MSGAQVAALAGRAKAEPKGRAKGADMARVQVRCWTCCKCRISVPRECRLWREDEEEEEEGLSREGKSKEEQEEEEMEEEG